LFLRALGLQDQEIYENIENSQFFKLTSQFDNSLSQEDCLLKIHSYLRPEESPTVKGCQQLLYSKFFDPKRYDLGFIRRYKLNRQFSLKTDENIHILTSMDVVHVINYLINFRNGAIQSDDIDHLGNRRIRSIGELLINQVRIGLNRLERIIHERMSICDPNYLRVNTLVNPKPFAASIREFFGSNPLSQFMDQTNPLAELTHKRRISVLGPGGITRDRAGFLIRDIHPSQYGRICPIETPEGPNAGLIGSLTTYTRVNSFGFLETPFYKVQNGIVYKNSFPIYLDALTEDRFRLAAGDVKIDTQNKILSKFVPVRYQRELITINSEDVDLLLYRQYKLFH